MSMCWSTHYLSQLLCQILQTAEAKLNKEKERTVFGHLQKTYFGNGVWMKDPAEAPQFPAGVLQGTKSMSNTQNMMKTTLFKVRLST